MAYTDPAPFMKNSQADDGPEGFQQNSGGPVSLFEFVSHSHTILGIYFAPPGETSAVLLPCMCCGSGNVTKGLTTRQRFFIFFFVLVCILFITIQVQLAQWTPTWLWIWLLTFIFVLPGTCRMKTELPGLSARIKESLPSWVPIQGEEALLLIFLIITIVISATEAGVYNTASMVADFFGTFAIAMVMEFFSLIYKYFCCRICCSCCLPPGQGNYSGKESQVV